MSQHQAGTHWLKYMLANALSDHYALPPPEFNHANDIIGGPKDEVVHQHIPRIISSHSIPPIVAAQLVRHKLLHLPQYILLVRDIRASLVSNYRKWQARYELNFSDFLRGDPAGHRFNSDIWWSIRFVNAWGKMLRAHEGKIIVVHYEKLLVNPHAELSRINTFLALPLTADNIQTGINAATKQEMIAKADPERPPGEVNKETVDVFSWFDSDDRRFFENHCNRFLKTTFNYDYGVWEFQQAP
ncbi:MAG: sulfotransferase domain-containing protein [Pseudomonadota bacterium]